MVLQQNHLQDIKPNNRHCKADTNNSLNYIFFLKYKNWKEKSEK